MNCLPLSYFLSHLSLSLPSRNESNFCIRNAKVSAKTKFGAHQVWCTLDLGDDLSRSSTSFPAHQWQPTEGWARESSAQILSWLFRLQITQGTDACVTVCTPEARQALLAPLKISCREQSMPSTVSLQGPRQGV